MFVAMHEECIKPGARAISHNTGPNIGMFVLIVMDYSF